MVSEFGFQHIEKAVWRKEETNCLLESNTLLLGVTQTGKSTLADIMINQVHETNKGKMVILEVKGERIKDIDDSDFVVSCSMSKDKKGKEFVWSVLREATASGNVNVEEKLARIYEPIFKEKLQKSTQPYFINAALNLLVGITYAMYLKYGVVSNKYLFHTIEEMDLADYYNILAETKIIKRYARDLPIINGKMSGQAAGVLGEFSHYIRLFSRMFREDGMDSIYDYCTSSESEKIYFLYDYNSREECNILYSILLNQVIAYKLSYLPITHQRIYMFLDEISVIDNAQIDLQYAVNIGTSKGLHLILAIQSIQFLMAIYMKKTINYIKKKNPKLAVIVDSRSSIDEITADVIRKCNEKEFCSTYKVQEAEIITKCYELSVGNKEPIIVTLGEKGTLISKDGQHFMISAFNVSGEQDTRGAGDAFTTGYILAKSCKLDEYSAGMIGNMFASCCVSQIATTGVISLEVVENLFGAGKKRMVG